MDRISELPDSLIVKILLGVPTLDAVRTCVLSKAWQFKWTMLPKLVLDVSFFRGTRPKKEGPYDYVLMVSNLLLQHVGPLEELFLVVPDIIEPKIDYLNQVIRVVLMRGIQKLTVRKLGDPPHTWPHSFPNSSSLTYLNLQFCQLKHIPFSRGFQNLYSLTFSGVLYGADTLSNCISNSPNLHKLVLQNLICDGPMLTIRAHKLIYLFLSGTFKNFHLQHSPNLKEMEVYLPSWLEIIAVPKHTRKKWTGLDVLEMDENFTLQHLEKVYIGPITGKRKELNFIRLLLHCSPALQQMALWHTTSSCRNTYVRFSKALGRFHCASPTVVIDVFHEYRNQFFRA